MQPELLKWLEDIRDSAEYIVSSTSDSTLESFAADRTLKQAIERNFEIIGEAMTRISRVSQSTAESLTGYQRIIAFRNILIHGYNHIDIEIVWQIIRNSLPHLLREVSLLLQKTED